MTPAARVAAAIEILDEVLAGAPAEQALTGWARASRYAGSGDRAAVRDHVFGTLRCRRSYAWLGGAETGRGVMLGALRAAGEDVEALFDGSRFGPAPLREAERVSRSLEDAPEAVRCDLPDWLMAPMRDSLGAAFDPVVEALRTRAPVFLRVNLLKSSVAQAAEALRDEGIGTLPHPLSPTALEVVENPRRVQGSAAYREGLVELQDVASQAVVDALSVRPGARVLDYCAGGGGKALALAARLDGPVDAHDANPGRMRDLPARATRATADIRLKSPEELRPGYDLAFCDAPCSGSGAWRRTPDAKWRLTPERLGELTALQAEILDTAAGLVAGGGCLAYATCSLLRAENAAQIDAFLNRHNGWTRGPERRLTPLDGGDGFYVAQIIRA